MMEDYKNALKAGQRAYRACVARGQPPYLAVLDDILVNVNIVAQESLGLVEIPAESIVGTKTSGRHTAFASNFMPLLEADTEFATKWSNLCDAHLEEGIQNPILAYEFMNRFYVQEGNKRVSVLKYYGAVKIAGTVTRLIPARNDSLENRIYYEFLDFYKLSQINYVHFSRTGGYAKLQTLVCKASGESWTEDDRLNFSSFYTVFRQQFIALGGHDLKLTTGDGLLVYLSVYRYADACEATPAQVEKLCAEAAEYHFASVCVNPVYIPLAARLLKGTGVKVCCVVGFPLGAIAPEQKAAEAASCAAMGAEELDMVIHVGAAKAGDWALVQRDIEGVVKAAAGHTVKVIIETCLLTDEEKVKACEAAKAAGAHFVKTSTGFSTGGATTHDIALMRKTVGPEMGVKASGGIRDYATAMAMIEAGANRIGASAGIAIVAAAE